MEYKRLLIKLSGESLKNGNDGIIDFNYILKICRGISKLKNESMCIGIVVGGGNIWRGRDNKYIDISSSDKIGILGTSINALVIKSAFDNLNIKSCLFNSFYAKDIFDKIPSKDELYNICKDSIIVFGGGTGNIGCSTDTASAMCANLIDADIIIKLTNVDGVYDMDPNNNKNAKKYSRISFDEVINNKLEFMDLDSIKICKNSNIDILVTNTNSILDIEKMIKEKKYSIIKLQ